MIVQDEILMRNARRDSVDFSFELSHRANGEDDNVQGTRTKMRPRVPHDHPRPRERASEGSPAAATRPALRQC